MLLCCSVLQCVAVCCSVLQCVAVCNSVLQCAKRRYSVVGLAQQSDMGRQRYIGSLISKVSFAREPCEIGLVWMTTSSSRIARPKERTIRHYRKIAILRGVCECVLHATPFPPTPLALPRRLSSYLSLATALTVLLTLSTSPLLVVHAWRVPSSSSPPPAFSCQQLRRRYVEEIDLRRRSPLLLLEASICPSCHIAPPPPHVRDTHIHLKFDNEAIAANAAAMKVRRRG